MTPLTKARLPSCGILARALVLGLTLLIPFLAACNTGTRSTALGSMTSSSLGWTDIRQSEPRLPPGDKSLFGIAGRTLWVPLAPPTDLKPGQPWTPEAEKHPLLDGTEPLQAELLGLVGSVNTTDRLAAPLPWLPEPVRWTPISQAEVLAGTAPRGQVLAWALAIEIPADLAYRQAITIDIGGPEGTDRLVVRLLPAPKAGLDTRRMVMPDASIPQWRRLGQRLRTEAVDPFRRWRMWLIMDRFGEKRLFGPGGFPSHDPMTNPVLRRISSMVEERWRIAISELSHADETTAAKLIMRLTGVATVPSGELVPVWPLDSTGEYSLLQDLLDPRLQPEQRIARAQEWLSVLPPTLAWVIDDAGHSLAQRDAPEGPDYPQHLVIDGARIGVLDLSSTASTVTIGPARGAPADRQRRATVQLIASGAGEAELLAISTDGSGAAPVLVRTGASTLPIAVVAAPLPARPPGLPMGPLVEGASLALLPIGHATPAPAAWATVVMLHRTSLGQWQVYVEGKRPGEEWLATDEMHIFLGPMGATAHELIVGPKNGAEAVNATTWSALLDLPPGAVRTGELLIGLTRHDPRGAIQAWPRPLLPGETEPGRMRIDLTQWGSFEGDFEGL